MQVRCHVTLKPLKHLLQDLYMILSLKDTQLHYLSSLDSCNTVTRMSLPTFLSYLQIFVLYCSMAWIDYFSSHLSDLGLDIFYSEKSLIRSGLSSLYHPGVSFTAVLHISIVFNSFTCLLSPLSELQESRGLLHGLITTKLPVITTTPGTL